MKVIFDKKAIYKEFVKGDLVLMWDKGHEDPGKHGKFDNLWIGPYLIFTVKGNNTFILADQGGENIEDPVNGRLMKCFFIY